jgi:hypothetical protein
MRLALIAVLAVACRPDTEVFPPQPGGGGIPGGGSAGSSVSAIPDGNPDLITGFVCVLDDPRDFSKCDVDEAQGLTVSLTGVPSVITGSDGMFTIMRPTGTNLTFGVSGSNVQSSTMGFGAASTVFAMSVETFQNLLGFNGVLVDPTQGTIMGVIVHNVTPVQLARVDFTPISTVGSNAFFSTTADMQGWSGSDTSAFGTFFIPGLTSPTETVTVTPPGGSASVISNVPVGSGAITFMIIEQ